MEKIYSTKLTNKETSEVSNYVGQTNNLGKDVNSKGFIVNDKSSNEDTWGDYVRYEEYGIGTSNIDDGVILVVVDDED